MKTEGRLMAVGAFNPKYFDPSPAPFMINYIVDNMDALLDRLKHEGVKIDAKRMDESYGPYGPAVSEPRLN
jgi:uncharacterized glyoxalase superfamily protein PhnB